MHRTDRIWLNLVIHGSETFTITGKTGPRLYFATADGEESEVSDRDRLLKLY